MRINRNNPWVCIPKSKQKPRLRLFCFPYAGGSAEMFYSWRQHLPEWVELCAIQLPGRSSRIHEPPLDQLDRLVAQLCQVIWELSELPFAVFGHSLGGMLAFELLRNLPDEISKKATILFVSARYAPRTKIINKQVHELSDHSFLEELAKFGGMTQEVLANKQLIDMLLPALRADFKLSETYYYQPDIILSCPIIGFAGNYDNLVSINSMKNWSTETTNYFKLHQFAGDHFFIRPFQKEMVEIISNYITKVSD